MSRDSGPLVLSPSRHERTPSPVIPPPEPDSIPSFPVIPDPDRESIPGGPPSRTRHSMSGEPTPTHHP